MNLYSEKLLCFSAFSNDISNSNKIILPVRILKSLESSRLMGNILFFKVENLKNEYGYICGVHDFTAVDGTCNVPYHIMNQIGVGEGDPIRISLYNPPSAEYIKLRPHTTAFIELQSPKSVLEHCLSLYYPVLNTGQTITVVHNGVNYYIDVMETRPYTVVQTINCDVNLDFDEPLDYQELQKEKQRREQEKKNIRQHRLKSFRKTTFSAFQGAGRKL